MQLSAARLEELSAKLGLSAEDVVRAYERGSAPVKSVVENGPSKARKRGGRIEIPDPSPDLGAEPVFAWLPLDCLFVDATYQRPITGEGWDRINRMVRGFRWSKFQPITVAGRDAEAGSFAIIDGQHRFEACKRHPKIERAPCYIVGGGEPASEAIEFVALNRNRTGLSTVNVFWAELVAGDPQAAAIARICAAAGVAIARSARGRLPPRTVAAMRALKAILVHGEAVAQAALQILAEAKPDEPGAFSQRIIVALAAFVADLGDDLDRGTLVAALKWLDPGRAAIQSRIDAKDLGIGWDEAMIRILAKAYGGGREADLSGAVTAARASRAAEKAPTLIRRPVQGAHLPSVPGSAPIRRDTAKDQALIETAIAAGKVTKCPTAAVAPTTSSGISEKDRKALAARGDAAREAVRWGNRGFVNPVARRKRGP